jgi:hypothetical protein
MFRIVHCVINAIKFYIQTGDDAGLQTFRAHWTAMPVRMCTFPFPRSRSADPHVDFILAQWKFKTGDPQRTGSAENLDDVAEILLAMPTVTAPYSLMRESTFECELTFPRYFPNACSKDLFISFLDTPIAAGI